MKRDPLTKAIKMLALIVLLAYFLFHARPFLAPIVFGGLLSMLLMPLCMLMERKGVSRGLAVTLSMIALLLVVGTIIGVLAWQLADLSKNAGNVEQNVNAKITQIRHFVTETFGVSAQKQNEIIQKQKQSSSNKITALVMGAMSSAGSALTNIIIVLVYVFLFMFFRTHLKNFMFRLVPDGQEEKTRQIMQDGRKVAHKYLTGMALMIASLWVMYGIGFSIVGVKNALFFDILCGLLEIVPFVGNLAGTGITLFMALAQGANMGVIIGIVLTYGFVQFVQSYFIEPMVVGKGVNLHPLFTIIGIIAGEFIWGIPGMVLAIPVLGVFKIICDHVELLKPYGYLLGEESSNEEGWISRIKNYFKRKFAAKASR